MRHMFLALEGLSASGKTTVGKLLAKQMSAIFYKTPASLFNSNRAVVDEKADLVARFFFYLAGIAQSSVEIASLCENQSVVCDRYLDTTVCYHHAMGVPTETLIGNVDKVLKMPDYRFLITCDHFIRIKRLYNRGLSYNDMIERGSGIEEKFLTEYKKRDMIEIDNSCADPQETVDKIIAYIKGRA